MAERFTAAQADLEFRAETGAARANVESLRRDFHTAMAGMSSDTLRLAVAQEKLDKALIRHGSTSTQAKQAELAYRREVDATTGSVNRNSAALDRHERELSQTTRGAIAGSGAMRGLGRSVAFASASFLGGAGLVYAVRQTINAAEEAQVVQGRLAQAVENAGLSWAANREQIDKTLQAQSKLSAFDDEDLATSLAKLVVRTKDVNEALRLNAIVADVARGRNISLEAASNLVLKASIGQAGALRRLGIDAKKGADAQQLLALIQEKYAGQAARFAGENAGKQAYFNKTLQDSEEIIGGALLPALADLSGKAAGYLETLNESGELQRDVNKAMKAGGEIAHGLAEGLDDARTVAEPVVDALGGLKNAAEAALIVGLALKARKAALAFGLIEAASARTRTRVVADAAAESAALDRVGGSAGRARGRLAGLAGVGLGAGLSIAGGQVGGEAGSALSTIGNTALAGSLFGPAGTIIGLGVGGGLAGVQYGRSETRANQARWNALSYAQQQAVLEKLGGQADAFLKTFDLTAKLPPVSVKVGRGQGAVGAGVRTVAPNTTVKLPARKPPPGGGLSELQRLQIAEATPGNELGDAQALLTYYRRVVENGKLSGDKLYQARLDVANQDAKVQAIIDGITADKQAAAEKRQAALERQRQADERARQKAVDAIRRAGLTGGPYATTSDEFSKYGITPAAAARKAAEAAKDKAPTKADIAASVREAMTAIVNVEQRYAPNFQLGRTETHLYELVHETRRSNDKLDDIGRRGGFPASAYSQVSAGVAGS